MNQTPTQSMDDALSLMLFTHRFSTAIECGISLVRSLLSLEGSAPPLGVAVHDINLQVQAGQTLSRAMSAHPEIFSPLYIVAVRAGEIGGVLDETLRRLAKLMLKEWHLIQRRPSDEPPFLLVQPGQPTLESWDELSSYRQTVTLILFCETFGMLLSSGVPIQKSVECVSALLPQRQAKIWVEAYSILEDREFVDPMISSSELTNELAGLGEVESFLPSIEKLGIFSPVTLEMLRVGKETGTFDLMLSRAAALYDIELECRWA